MSASTTSDLPTIVELKPRGQFLPALVTCSALDRRRRQLPTATLVLHSNTGAHRARYVRADGRETEVWFDNTSYALLDEIAPKHLPLARKRYHIPEPVVEAEGRRLRSLEQLMGWPESGGYQEYGSDNDEPAPVQDLPISAGSRVEVTFGPDEGQPGTVHRALDHTSYIAVKLDQPGPWSVELYLPEEIRRSIVPPPEERPWANDAAYAVLGE